MINMEIKTKLTPEEALNRIKTYFGEGGLGLNLDDSSPGCLNFSGTGGYVNAVVCSDKEKTRIELISQEYEYDVKAFAKSLS